MARNSVYFQITAVHNKHEVKSLKRELDTLPGVSSVSINAAEGRVAVDFDDTGISRGQPRQKLASMGCDVTECPAGQ